MGYIGRREYTWQLALGSCLLLRYQSNKLVRMTQPSAKNTCPNSEPHRLPGVRELLANLASVSLPASFWLVETRPQGKGVY